MQPLLLQSFLISLFLQQPLVRPRSSRELKLWLPRGLTRFFSLLWKILLSKGESLGPVARDRSTSLRREGVKSFSWSVALPLGLGDSPVPLPEQLSAGISFFSDKPSFESWVAETTIRGV